MFKTIFVQQQRLLEFTDVFEEDQNKQNLIDALINSGIQSIASQELLKTDKYESIDDYLKKRREYFKELIDEDKLDEYCEILDHMSDFVKLFEKNKTFKNQENGDSLLHIVIQKGQIQMIPILIDEGYDVNSLNNCQQNVLHQIFMAQGNVCEYVKLLSEKGVNVSQ